MAVSSRTFRLSIGAVGLAMLLAAFAWWGILFPTVVQNTGLSLFDALPCLVSNSSICRLEAALCGGQHLFGIRHYSPELCWLGLLLIGSAGALAGLGAASGLAPEVRRGTSTPDPIVGAKVLAHWNRSAEAVDQSRTNPPGLPKS